MTFLLLPATTMKQYFACVVTLLLFFSCSNKKEDDTLFQLVENSGIDFTNKVENSPEFNIFSYRNFYNGGGVAIGDINNDGLSDVFMTANMGSNKLYINKGNFQFDDVSEKAGIGEKEKWSTGVVMVDVNADGWLDIYVCNAGYQRGVGQENSLFINNHDLTFTECARKYGLADSGYTTHAAFFDYDIDGDLDCYILNNSFIPVNTLNYENKRNLRAEDWPVANFLKGGGDKLLRNENGKFVDVSKEANIYGSLIGFGLGVTVGDINNDHYPDLYISNDFFERDYLYVNQKDGTFKEDLEQCMQHTSLASMGADIGDINNDGYPDIFTTDMLPDDDKRLKTITQFDNIDVYRIKEKQGFYHQYMQNTLQLNNKDGSFSEVGYYSGVAASDWSWGGLIFDADNDGLSDIFVCNGIYHDLTDQDFLEFFANDIIRKMAITGKKEEVDNIINKMPSRPIANKAFRNAGGVKFTDEGEVWGLHTPSFSNGAAYGDLDNDGDLDLVVNNLNQKSFLYKNKSQDRQKTNAILLKLVGKGQNTHAIGAQVKIYANKEVITREVIPSRGFQSSVDYKVVAGVGDRKIDSIHVIWPDLTQTTMINPTLNNLYTLQQTKGINRVESPSVNNDDPYFQMVKHNFSKHQEDDHTDFYFERGIPAVLSREGPQGTQGDVNGDGLMDMYIGGTAVQAGQLYLQSANGFILKEQKAFTSTGIEEVAVLFFDCDKDGDLDLVTGAGGNNQPVNSFSFQSRLFINDGKGNFTFTSQALPLSGVNTSVIIDNDFDNDGDLDLFVGSRSVPQDYGLVPNSFLLLNDGKGRFTDATKSLSQDIATVGMVTGAVWADVVGDVKQELVIVGEWLGPRIFSYSSNRFNEVSSNLNQLKGWWQTIAAADLDSDKKTDLILGNIGENFYLQPSDKVPVKMWIADFDNNGKEEKIITQTINGKDLPVFLKKDLTDQIPSLKKQNLKYKDFAQKSIQDLFPAKVLEKCQVQLFNYSSSTIAFNNGNGQFKVQPLPMDVQVSCVNKVKAIDINHDNMLDLVMGGNKFHFLPQFSRLDASYGNVLINQGKRQFTCLNSIESGLKLKGEVKDIIAIKNKGRQYVMFLQNNDFPQLFELKAKQNKLLANQ
jgi:hypothetical protein